MKVGAIVQARMSSQRFPGKVLYKVAGKPMIQYLLERLTHCSSLDSVILAKFDSTAKGGIVLPICRTLGLPFSFVGTGEGLGDLEPFDREEYLRNMLDT